MNWGNGAVSDSQPADDGVQPAEQVPDSVIPAGELPPLEYRELPDSIPLRKMIGPGIILAGLSLGSGEFIIWPRITFDHGFVLFWVCILGVTMQYFINMEIARWTLATGESAVTGFCRQSKYWAPVFLACNILPWMIPAWATAGAELLSWLCWPEFAGQPNSPYVGYIAIGTLFLCGILLTAGPVVYETIEKTQIVLVTAILILVVVIACQVVRAPSRALGAAANATALPSPLARMMRSRPTSKSFTSGPSVMTVNRAW